MAHPQLKYLSNLFHISGPFATGHVQVCSGTHEQNYQNHKTKGWSCSAGWNGWQWQTESHQASHFYCQL